MLSRLAFRDSECMCMFTRECFCPDSFGISRTTSRKMRKGGKERRGGEEGEEERTSLGFLWACVLGERSEEGRVIQVEKGGLRWSASLRATPRGLRSSQILHWGGPQQVCLMLLLSGLPSLNFTLGWLMTSVLWNDPFLLRRHPRKGLTLPTRKSTKTHNRCSSHQKSSKGDQQQKQHTSRTSKTQSRQKQTKRQKKRLQQQKQKHKEQKQITERRTSWLCLRGRVPLGSPERPTVSLGSVGSVGPVSSPVTGSFSFRDTRKSHMASGELPVGRESGLKFVASGPTDPTQKRTHRLVGERVVSL